MIWYYFWTFIAGFAETITTIDSALSCELRDQTDKTRQMFFRTVLVVIGVGSMTAFGACNATHTHTHTHTHTRRNMTANT